MKAPERTPEDRASGVIRITIGNLTRRVPTLKLTAAEAWLEREAAIPDGDASASAGAIEKARLEAVLAYDVTNALGGREYVAAHADWDQIYVAFHQMMAVVRPFTIEQLHEMELLGRLLEHPDLLTLLSSSSGPSLTGDSTPEPSESDSTPSSSPSSGPPDRSEPAETPAFA
jgi:hypothetical protein